MFGYVAWFAWRGFFKAQVYFAKAPRVNLLQQQPAENVSRFIMLSRVTKHETTAVLVKQGGCTDIW